MLPWVTGWWTLTASYVRIDSTAVFSFEGIGLVRHLPLRFTCAASDIVSQVIPITDAMREPRKFPAVLTGVMLLLMGEFLYKILTY